MWLSDLHISFVLRQEKVLIYLHQERIFLIAFSCLLRRLVVLRLHRQKYTARQRVINFITSNIRIVWYSLILLLPSNDCRVWKQSIVTLDLIAIISAWKILHSLWNLKKKTIYIKVIAVCVLPHPPLCLTRLCGNSLNQQGLHLFRASEFCPGCPSYTEP